MCLRCGNRDLVAFFLQESSPHHRVFSVIQVMQHPGRSVNHVLIESETAWGPQDPLEPAPRLCFSHTGGAAIEWINEQSESAWGPRIASSQRLVKQMQVLLHGLLLNVDIRQCIAGRASSDMLTLFVCSCCSSIYVVCSSSWQD